MAQSFPALPTVIALGGNAFAARDRPLTMRGQLELAERVLTELVPLFRADAPVLLTHGNGPQVGHMLTRVERSLGEAYAIPLEVCVAETEGELGYVLLQTAHNVLARCGLRRPLVSVLTQVRVDPADPAFDAPTKPIGPFYDAERARALCAEGFTLHEDAGRGFRRVVASPEPRQIVDVDVLERLWAMGALIIAAGGGGVPVVERDGRLEGVEAVVDKDATAALLGEVLGARRLLLVTAVPYAYRHFGTGRQSPIRRATAAEARALLAEGHFAPGSMEPKMRAAARFVERTGGECLVCDPETISAALAGRAGTRVVRDENARRPE